MLRRHIYVHLTNQYLRVIFLDKAKWGEVNWLFNVTINDISVIYVTAHRCAGGLKKKLDLRSGSQRHRHFVGFFNVSDRHGTTLFIRWFRHTAPFSRLLRSRWGYGGHILDLTPPGPHGGRLIRLGYCFTPYQRLWLYNGAPLVAFYDTLGIRRTSSRLKPPASSRGWG